MFSQIVSTPSHCFFSLPTRVSPQVVDVKDEQSPRMLLHQAVDWVQENKEECLLGNPASRQNGAQREHGLRRRSTEAQHPGKRACFQNQSEYGEKELVLNTGSPHQLKPHHLVGVNKVEEHGGRAVPARQRCLVP